MDTWVIALATSGAWTLLCAAIVWFSRTWFAKRIAGSIDHHYNVKLENLRSELRGEEELVKARIKSYEIELEAIRSAALTRASSRQHAFDQKRLAAIDQLWDGVGKLANLKNASRLMQKINFEEAIKHAPKDPDVRKYFEVLSKVVNLEKIERSNAHDARPFVSKSAWAMYLAYASIGSVAAIQLISLKNGIEFNKPVDEQALTDLIAKTLPHQLPLIEEHGIGAVHFLMDELEERLLDEIEKMLRADVESDDDLKRAAAIVKSASSLNAVLSPDAALSAAAQ